MYLNLNQRVLDKLIQKIIKQQNLNGTNEVKFRGKTNKE